MLLGLTLVLYQTFSLAVAQHTQPQIAPAILSVAVMSEESQEPTIVPILDAETASIREVQAISYISTLEPLRQQLRNAIDSYRNATNQPGGASVSHVAAARQLRTHVEHAYVTLEELTPPQSLQDAHNDYVRGLGLELEAIEAVLEFYSSYEVGAANRAALRFQEAGLYFDRARAVFGSHDQQVELSSAVSSFTPR